MRPLDPAILGNATLRVGLTLSVALPSVAALGNATLRVRPSHFIVGQMHSAVTILTEFSVETAASSQFLSFSTTAQEKHGLCCANKCDTIAN
jgi:hypothetical protein